MVETGFEPLLEMSETVMLLKHSAESVEAKLDLLALHQKKELLGMSDHESYLTDSVTEENSYSLQSRFQNLRALVVAVGVVAVVFSEVIAMELEALPQELLELQE